MKTSLVIRGGIFWLALFSFWYSEARQEYAVRFNNIQCTSCHYSPTGGGPRNLNGKLFQGRWFNSDPFVVQDYVSADFRTMLFFPELPDTTRSGMGVMSASVAGHFPLTKDKSTYLVVDQNVAGFLGASLRDTYLLHRFDQPAEYKWFESIMVGRFRAPFGIVTDEHRTYTRMQTGSQWFTFDTGLMLSGSPSDKVHYDLALVNGQNSDGQSLGAGQAKHWGSVFNIRYMPSFFWLGASGRVNETPEDFNSHAVSLYSVISFSRISLNRIPATLKLEYSQAKGFSDVLSHGYTSNPAYAASLKKSVSEGILVQVDWNITNRWLLTYKYDLLKPDMQFPADMYDRHGLGFRWAMTAYTQLWFRSEIARATQPSEISKAGLLAQDANFLILEASF